MLAANTPLFPVLNEKKLPFSPRKTPGTSKRLQNFREAIRDNFLSVDLTQSQYLVLDVLCSHADTCTGYCFPSRQRIARKLKIDPVTVSKATTRLQELGIIAKFGRGGFSSSCDYVILFSIEAFALAEVLQRGELDRFRLRHRDTPLPINLEEARIDEEDSSFDPEITGSGDPGITRNEQAQMKGFMASVDTQPEETGSDEVRAKRPGPRTPRLTVLPEHWMEDARRKRPDLDIRHVAGKFLAYHGKRGVRATPRWYGAWIRWVERENTALDRHPGKARAAAAPVKTAPAGTSPTIPQTGTSRPAPAPEVSRPPVSTTPSPGVATSTPKAPEPPRQRSRPPVSLSSLVRPRVAPSAPLPGLVDTHTQETPLEAHEAPVGPSLDVGGTSPGGMADAERERRWREMLMAAEGKHLADFRSG
jgi:hypothetical protein